MGKQKAGTARSLPFSLVVKHWQKNYHDVVLEAAAYFFGEVQPEVDNLPDVAKERLDAWFLEWFIFEYLFDSHETPLSDYLERNPDKLQGEAYEGLRQARNTQFVSDFWVEDVRESDAILVLKDISNGTIYEVKDYAASKQLEPDFGQLGARLVQVDGQWLFAGNQLYYYPVKPTKRMKDMLEDHPDNTRRDFISILKSVCGKKEDAPENAFRVDVPQAILTPEESLQKAQEIRAKLLEGLEGAAHEKSSVDELDLEGIEQSFENIFAEENAELRKELIDDASVMPPLHTLRDILELKDREELKTTARFYTKEKIHSQRSTTLIEIIASAVQEPQALVNLLASIDLFSWNLFKETARAYEYVPEDYELDSIEVLRELGLVELFYQQDEDTLVLVVANEIKDTFALVIDSLDVWWEHYELLDEYAAAAASLYGVIGLDELTRLFCEHYDTTIPVEEWEDMLPTFNSSSITYLLSDGYLINFKIFRDHSDDEDPDAVYEAIEDLKNAGCGKPRFIPPLEEFLCYAIPFYYEDTPQLAEFEVFLVTEIGLDLAEAERLAGIMHFASFAEIPLSDLVTDVAEGLELDGFGLAALTKHISNVHNNTRIWSNNGHTPNELFLLSKGAGASDARELHGTPARKSTRVGRNEPCPCGSGKKYKNCCGKQQ